MKITLEQIDLLRKRTNAGYKEAKEALEYADGDIVGALAYLDEQGKEKKTKMGTDGGGLMDKIRKWYQRGKEIKLVVSKEGKDYLRISLNMLIILGLIFNFWLTPALVAAVLAILLGYKVYFEDHAGMQGIEIIRTQQMKTSPQQSAAQEAQEAEYTEI